MTNVERNCGLSWGFWGGFLQKHIVGVIFYFSDVHESKSLKPGVAGSILGCTSLSDKLLPLLYMTFACGGIFKHTHALARRHAHTIVWYYRKCAKLQPGPKVIFFPCSFQLSTKFILLKMLKCQQVLAFKHLLS